MYECGIQDLENLANECWKPKIDTSECFYKEIYNNELACQAIQAYNPAICEGEAQSIAENSPEVVDRAIELFGSFEESLLKD